MIYGYVSTRFRSIRAPLFIGFLLLTAGVVGLATVQPKGVISALAFTGLAVLGFGAPLILLIAAVQLSTPHHLIATCSRAVASTVFTAIFAATFSARVQKFISDYVSQAVLDAGLPSTSIGELSRPLQLEMNRRLIASRVLTLLFFQQEPTLLSSLLRTA